MRAPERRDGGFERLRGVGVIRGGVLKIRTGGVDCEATCLSPARLRVRISKVTVAVA
jgi:hypothetical protein